MLQGEGYRHSPEVVPLFGTKGEMRDLDCRWCNPHYLRMNRKKRHLTAEFKAGIALEAIKGEKTAAEIARDRHRSRADQRVEEAARGTPWRGVPEQGRTLQGTAVPGEKEARLERKVGQLVIEEDFLVKRAGDRSDRKAMIEKHQPKVSARKQCKLLGVNRNRLDPRPPRKGEGDEAIMKEIDRIYIEFPFSEARKIIRELRGIGIRIGRKRCRRLMRAMGIDALVPKPSTSVPNKQHRKYPTCCGKARWARRTRCGRRTFASLRSPFGLPFGGLCPLRSRSYVPMYEGHVCLVAIMDWHTRAVLSWRVFTTMDAGFCVEATRDAVAVADRAPDIINCRRFASPSGQPAAGGLPAVGSDRRSPFTGETWIEAVEASGARASMDGKGRWIDNIFIERLWRSLKYEELRLWSYGTLAEVTARIGKWMDFYNHRRKHQALDFETPWSLYRPGPTGDEKKTLTSYLFPPRGKEAKAA